MCCRRVLIAPGAVAKECSRIMLRLVCASSSFGRAGVAAPDSAMRAVFTLLTAPIGATLFSRVFCAREREDKRAIQNSAEV